MNTLVHGVEPARTRNAEILSNLALKIGLETYSALGSEDQIRNWLMKTYSVDALSENLESSKFHCFFLGPEKNPLGMAHLRDDGSEVFLGGFFCRVKWEGVGQALLDQCLEIARQLKVDVVRTELFATNDDGWQCYEEDSFLADNELIDVYKLLSAELFH
jgi:hypothetical protein